MAYEIQLNIGLDVSDRFPFLKAAYGVGISPSLAVDAIYDIADEAGVSIRSLSHRVDHSDTEQTVVARIRFDGILKAANFILCAASDKGTDIISSLGQDCIALYMPGYDEGVLLGKHRDAWGTFNKDYFIEW